MARSGDFNVTAAGGLVLGGIAALLLATAIALGGYGRPHRPATPVDTAPAAPRATAAGGAHSDAEYLLDTSEEVTAPERSAREPPTR